MLGEGEKMKFTFLYTLKTEEDNGVPQQYFSRLSVSEGSCHAWSRRRKKERWAHYCCKISWKLYIIRAPAMEQGLDEERRIKKGCVCPKAEKRGHRITACQQIDFCWTQHRSRGRPRTAGQYPVCDYAVKLTAQTLDDLLRSSPETDRMDTAMRASRFLRQTASSAAGEETSIVFLAESSSWTVSLTHILRMTSCKRSVTVGGRGRENKQCCSEFFK